MTEEHQTPQMEAHLEHEAERWEDLGIQQVVVVHHFARASGVSSWVDPRGVD
jgi:hypothetical protein